MQAAWRGAGTGVLMLFKGVRGVGKVHVHGSVDEEFARWLEGCMRAGVGEAVRPYEGGEVRADGVEVHDAWSWNR